MNIVQKLSGLNVVCFKQGEANILCKISMIPSDAIALCERLKSGSFKNREIHDIFINEIVSQLERVVNENGNV